MFQLAVAYFGKTYSDSIKSIKEVMPSSYKTPNKMCNCQRAMWATLCQLFPSLRPGHFLCEIDGRPV